MASPRLNCPSCGAPASPDDAHCDYCGSTLATMACPSCFAAMFAGMRFCPSCGAEAARNVVDDHPSVSCPGCGAATHAVKLGATVVDECPECDGAWLDATTFRSLCADRERRAALLEVPPPAETPQTTPLNDPVRYVPCPVCRTLMDRVNFARVSGVIIDVCKSHGVWFGRGELHRVIRFIDGGGLERAKEFEQRRALEMKKLEAELWRTAAAGQTSPPSSERFPLTRPTGASAWTEDVTLGAIVKALHDLFS